MGRLIDADRLKEVFSRNVAGGNAYFDLIDSAPTVEAIPKDQYEARLKDDMVAMLTELKLDIEKQCKIPNNCASAYDWNNGVYACYKAVQQKIDALKGEDDDKGV